MNELKTNIRLELGLFHTSKRDELLVGIKWCKTESPEEHTVYQKQSCELYL